MINITDNQSWHIAVLDSIARQVLGGDISGVSVGGQSIIHITNDTQANRNNAQAIFDGFGDLAVSASVVSMTEGDTNPVVTCNDSAISGDASLGYLVTMDGIEYASGTVDVTAGEATLTLTEPDEGDYIVYMWRATGDYASGQAEITVNGV